MPMLCTVLGLEACSHFLEVESVKAFSLSSLYDSSFSLIFHILFNLILHIAIVGLFVMSGIQQSSALPAVG